MKYMLAVYFIASLGGSLATQCPPDHTKQKLTFIPTNNFYTPNFYRNGNNWPNQTERDAILHSGRTVWMKPDACYKIKLDRPGKLIQMCGSTKFADTIIFKYVQNGVERTEVMGAGSPNEFTNKCFNKFGPLIDHVMCMRICFGASQDVKFEKAYVAMCVPHEPDEEIPSTPPLTGVAFSAFAENFTAYSGAETLNFTGIITNDGGAFDGTNTFTCPVHGIYAFSVTIKMVNSGTTGPSFNSDLAEYVEIFRDAESIMQVWGDGDDITDLVASVATVIIECQAGQTVHVAAGNADLTVFGGPERTSVFTGFLLYRK